MQAAFHGPDLVYAEQVRSSYAHLPLTLSVSVLNSLLLGFVLPTDATRTAIMLWITIVAAFSGVRLVLWYVHRRRDVGVRFNRRWAQLAIAGALISGILWGSGVFIFAPLQEPELLFLALVISGMCAGAATVHAAHFPSVLAFIVPAVLPLAIAFFIQGSRLQVVSGLMACVFGLSLCLASLKFQRWFRATTAARLALATQSEQLNDANTRLRNEIASHRSTEVKLQHAQKMEAIGSLTAGIAHDFNNLLMAIGGYAGLILSRIGLNSPAGGHAVSIMQSVDRGTSLTRQLLVFGRKQTLLPRVTDINDMLLGMQNLLATTLGGYGDLRLEFDRSVPMNVLVDTNQLENSILNLVINARDAMPNGGSVTVRTTSLDLIGTETGTEGLVGQFARISVSDTGVGMTEQVRLRAFDPFFTTKETGKGSGLGLSQVYGLVQQSGGVVRLDSRPDEGTTVSIYLPKVAEPVVRAEAPRTLFREAVLAMGTPESDAHCERRRIILIDDDETVRKVVSEMLIEAGYAVESFAMAAPALDELRSPRRVDLIIVDLAMPTLRGDQFAVEARLQRPTIPVLFITGHAETTSLEAERWVLRKPFGASTLMSTIEEAMRMVA